MGKHEPFSPKAIANRIKSKGLQKLRWYCEMCQKQCRDANGFKCHTSSEAHQRQLLIFGESPGKFLSGFSGDFEKGYMDILRRQYGTRRVAANQVYQEYIKDKMHVHMNATRWVSLTGFVLYLGKSGKAVVDETEKGWFIKYIERDPEELRRQEQLRRREKYELDDEERIQQAITEQVEKAKETTTVMEPEFTPLPERSEQDHKVAFSLLPIKKEEDEEPSTSHLPSVDGPAKAPMRFNALQLLAKSSGSSMRGSSLAKSTTSEKRPLSALEEIIQEERKKKQSQPKKDYWLHQGIIVKVTTTRPEMKEYYKKKGLVTKVLDDKYTGMIKMLDSGAVIKLDQVHVETVLPNIGKAVLIVNGPYSGETATLLSIDEKSFSASVRLTSGSARDSVISKVAYEDICKLHQL